jgi:predicted membrane protein
MMFNSWPQLSHCFTVTVMVYVISIFLRPKILSLQGLKSAPLQQQVELLNLISVPFWELAGLAQSVQRLATGWTTEGSESESQ